MQQLPTPAGPHTISSRADTSCRSFVRGATIQPRTPTNPNRANAARTRDCPDSSPRAHTDSSVRAQTGYSVRAHTDSSVRAHTGSRGCTHPVDCPHIRTATNNRTCRSGSRLTVLHNGTVTRPDNLATVQALPRAITCALCQAAGHLPHRIAVQRLGLLQTRLVRTTNRGIDLSLGKGIVPGAFSRRTPLRPPIGRLQSTSDRRRQATNDSPSRNRSHTTCDSRSPATSHNPTSRRTGRANPTSRLSHITNARDCRTRSVDTTHTCNARSLRRH